MQSIFLFVSSFFKIIAALGLAGETARSFSSDVISILNCYFVRPAYAVFDGLAGLPFEPYPIRHGPALAVICGVSRALMSELSDTQLKTVVKTIGGLEYYSHYSEITKYTSIFKDETLGVSGVWVGDQGGGKVPIVVEKDEVTILYAHGGGYLLGNAYTHFETHMAWIKGLNATGLKARVFSLEYRLMPEHIFPAPVEDFVKAYEYIIRTLCVDPNKIFFAGDSAGANLAIAPLQKIKEQNLPFPAGCILFSPDVDLSDRLLDRSKIHLDVVPLAASKRLKARYLNVTMDNKAGSNFEQRMIMAASHPMVSPLNQDLSSHPPVIIFAGQMEPFLDVAISLGKMLTSAFETPPRSASFVELIVEPKGVHNYAAVKSLGELTGTWENSVNQVVQFIVKVLRK